MVSSSPPHTAIVAVGSALFGAAVYAGLQKLFKKTDKPLDPETDYDYAHQKIWGSIGAALESSLLYVGDRLQLYHTMAEACSEPGSSITAVELAQLTGYKQRWLREWLAQQASMGILKLLPGTGSEDADLHYRLPKAVAEVFTDKTSEQYDISMIRLVPSLVQRAKTMLPDAFETGIGRPYDDAEVAGAINEHHLVDIKHVVIPKVIPAADNGKAYKMLSEGCKVADLGCGAGNLVISLAKAFPKSSFYGYEVSEPALAGAATNLARARLTNANVVDANVDSLGDHKDEYDVITTFDVLHDAPSPAELIAQVKSALKPGGVWLLADIKNLDDVRANVEKNPDASLDFAFSNCLCMACSLSTKDGAGLGTLGFTVPVAKKMLTEGGFSSVEVLLEHKATRWFVVKQ